MEILYLWIKDYRIFKNTGFNFSDKYFFEVRYTENESFNITVKENPDYVENFFENKKISNITALVGKNGTGKTTLFDFFKDNLVDGALSNLDNELLNRKVLVVGKNYAEEPKYYVIHNLNEPLYFSEKSVLNLEGSVLGFSPFSKNPTLKNVSYIFYSNIFDLKRETEDPHGLLNISTNFLIKEDKNISILNPHTEISEVDAHILFEILRNIEFIFVFKDYTLPIKTPDLISIYPTNFDEQYLFKEKDSEWNNNDNLTALFEFIKKIRKSQSLDDPKTNFLNKIFESAFFNFIRTYELGGNYTKLVDLFLKNSNSESARIYYDYFVLLSNNKSELQDFSNRAVNTLQFFDYIINYVNSDNSIIDDNELLIPVNDENDQMILEFIKTYFKSILINSYIGFQWKIIENNELRKRNLSSGEQSLLTLFSRFYNLKNNLGRGAVNLKDDLIILIDEGDIYFHPEWQRNYFNNFLRLLKLIFYDNNLQLIFATNSPFLVSELPKSNIIFFGEKDKEGNAVIIPENEKPSATFASNIHTLYSDAFFMNNVMGEFAKRKINKIIETLNVENFMELHEKDISTLRKTISLIGEELIRDSLLQQLEIMSNPKYKDYNFFQRSRKPNL